MSNVAMERKTIMVTMAIKFRIFKKNIVKK